MIIIAGLVCFVNLPARSRGIILTADERCSGKKPSSLRHRQVGESLSFGFEKPENPESLRDLLPTAYCLLLTAYCLLPTAS